MVEGIVDLPNEYPVQWHWKCIRTLLGSVLYFYIPVLCAIVAAVFTLLILESLSFVLNGISGIKSATTVTNRCVVAKSNPC